MSYQTGPVRDLARLLRGILRPSKADPFIQQNPHALGKRDTLFRWDSIEPSACTATFEGYVPYVSPEPLLMQHLPASAGRRAFTHLMQAAPERISLIVALLDRHGLSVQGTPESWQSIAAFVVEHISPSAQTKSAIGDGAPVDKTAWIKLRGERFAAPLWHSISVDLSLLMAAQAMHLKPQLGWRFWADSAYDEPAAFGRSPWLQDTTASGDKPVRTLLLESMSTNINNALETRLNGRADPLDVPLDVLFQSLVKTTT